MIGKSNRQAKLDYDVIIVGGGMVGLALTAKLAQLDLRVAVIDPKPVELSWDEKTVDARVSAMTRASQKLFQDVGAWQLIEAPYRSDYQRMFVWDGESSRGKIAFDASLIAEQNLGYIIENRVLRRALYQSTENVRTVDWLCPEKCQAVDYQENYAELTLASGKRMKASLLVAADGAFSWLRKASDIGQEQQAYGHKAIVCTVKTEKPHQKTAWQRFDHHGPLAFLPLANSHLCSIVWSVDEAYAEELLTLNVADFEKRLSQTFEMSLGQVTLESRPVSFPLYERTASAMALHRLALIGDAAHTIHPLAGQGVNLGFSDALELAKVIETSLAKGADIGLKHRLRPFERARKSETKAMQLAMQSFKRLFEQEIPALQMARSYGLAMTDKHPLLKQTLIRKAMGL
ncbi:UbiH/UbiF/VisC/COQ6 family ubiquinone biosynthesis hydroxylase [Kangiella marina]|uniref:FAD-dependent 2-octaprenylphenol hydroxylase n=1 Tax=Kangiella marina TaxID=1079178 RepID=A0ABP8IIX9_9GAMM